MINLKGTGRLCTSPGCGIVSSYGYEKGRPLYCEQHHPSGTTPVIGYRCAHIDCNLTARYRLPGKLPQFCSKHHPPGTSTSANRRCTHPQCKEYATHGISSLLTCEEHALPEHLNLLEFPCLSCGLIYQLSADKLCHFCSAYPKVRLQKQSRVLAALQKLPLTITSYDETIDGGECSRRRPDFFYDMGSHCVIVECDEDQHKGRECKCEQQRMIEIHQSLEGRPLLFIRYNPDDYKISGEKMDTPEKARLDMLSKILLEASVSIGDGLSAVYLFYDDSSLEAIPVSY